MRDISAKTWTFVALIGLVFAILPAPGPVLAVAPGRSAISPADGSSSVAITTNLVITFNQNVEQGTGNITIRKFHGGAVQTIDVTSAQVTGWSTTAITIDIADLEAGTDYYVNYPSTAFRNSASEFASAITDSTSWNFTTAGEPWSGAGTQANPWQISSCNQLLAIDGRTLYLDDFFIISSDINCTGTTIYPMRHATNYFSGSLNGNNKIISGLSINCTTTHCGLFSLISDNATVYDLVFTSPTVSSTTSHVGVIAGQSSSLSTRITPQLSNIRINGGSITGANYTASLVGLAVRGIAEDVQSSASISGADYTGGIFGQLGNSSTACTSTSNLTRVSDAQFSGSIGGKARVGGIVGAFTTSSSTDDCGVFDSANTGGITPITGCTSVGGVVGDLSRGTVSNSSNSGSIAASACPSTGGVIGGMSGSMSSGFSTSSHVLNSWNTGSVSGKWYIGGVVGYCDYGYSTLTRVFNTGSVTSSSGQVGGIIGVSTCVIVDSFSRATITSSSIAGGAVGDGGGAGGSVVEIQRVYSASNKGFLGRRDTSLLSGALCENSFWDTTLASTTPGTCATSTSPAGKTTSEMKTQATFTGWDFVNHWAIDATVNDGYPFLRNVGVSALSGGSAWLASDTTAPTSSGSITATTTSSTSFTVSYSATDAVAVSSVTVYYSSNSNLSSPTSCGSATGLSGTSASGTITCTLVSPTDGTTYYVFTRATDSSSNTETAPGSADDTIAYDTTVTTTTSTTSTTSTSSTTSSTSSTTSTTIAPVVTAVPSATTTTSSTTSTTSTTTSTTVPLGTVGINSWTISSSANPAIPGSRIVLTTTISCGRQMSTNSPPYYPSMYYMVRSTPWINGVYGRPTLSADRRTATFTVAVTAPSTVGTYQMYAYGRDNPFGRTCTGNSFNFAASSVFTLAVGETIETTTTSTLPAEAPTTSTSIAIVAMPAITTTTTTPASTTTEATVVSTTSSAPIATATSSPAPIVQLDVNSAIRLPQDTTDFVVTRDSLLAIVENLQITNGIIRVKTSDGAWTEQNIANISDMVLLIGSNSTSLEVEVLEEGSTTPIAYSVPFSNNSSGSSWLQQVSVAVLGLGAMWLFIVVVKRRRHKEQLPPPLPPSI